jgi:hypothetical protein
VKSSKRSLRDLVYTGPGKVFKFCGDPGEILSNGPSMKIWKMTCIAGACLAALVGCSYRRFLYTGLVGPSL